MQTLMIDIRFLIMVLYLLIAYWSRNQFWLVCSSLENERIALYGATVESPWLRKLALDPRLSSATKKRLSRRSKSILALGELVMSKFVSSAPLNLFVNLAHLQCAH